MDAPHVSQDCAAASPAAPTTLPGTTRFSFGLWFDRAVLTLMWLVALGLAVRTAWVAYGHLLPAPVCDAYSFWVPLAQHGFRIADLFLEHNEHIIVFPRLCYLADTWLAAGTGVLLWGVSCLLMAAIPLVIGYIGRRYFFTNNRQALMYCALITACYCNGTHLINLVWGFMVQHWIESLAVVLLCWCFARLATAEHRGGWLLYAASVALAFVAVFTMGSGLACLMAAVVVGLLFRLRWQPVLLFAILAIVFTTACLNYNPPPPGRVQAVLHSPLEAAKFFLACLGGPFLRCVAWPQPAISWQIHPLRAVALGAVLLTAAVVFLARETFRRDRPGTFSVFHAILIVYTLGSDAMLVLSRFAVATYYSTEPKYAATSLLAWIGVFSLGLKVLAERWPLPARAQSVAWLACLTGLMFLVVPAQLREQRIMHDWNTQLWDTEASHVAGVFDRATITTFPNQQMVGFAASQQYLRPRRLAMYHRYPYALGDRLADHFTVVPSTACLGAFDQCLPVDHGQYAGYSVEGWAWDKTANQPVHDLVLCEPGGRIVGVAHSTRNRGDVSLVFPFVDYRCGWFGYVRREPAGTPISAYAIVNQGRGACLIGQAKLP